MRPQWREVGDVLGSQVREYLDAPAYRIKRHNMQPRVFSEPFQRTLRITIVIVRHLMETIEEWHVHYQGATASKNPSYFAYEVIRGWNMLEDVGQNDCVEWAILKL